MTANVKEHIVLLIDDDRNVLYALSRALRPQDYRLYTATSAAEAMMVLKAHPVDVLVSDEQMPGMRGTDLLIWAAEHYPDIVRIVLTGRATTETAIRAINAGHVYQFFIKPCNPSDLDLAIRKALQHKDLVGENRRLGHANQGHVEELERIRTTIEALVRIVVQDVQKPLGAVAESCRSLEDRHGEILDDRAKGLIDRALEGISEVERLVNRLDGHCRQDPVEPPPSTVATTTV